MRRCGRGRGTDIKSGVYAGVFKPRAYALVFAGSVAYLAPATLETQDSKTGTAIYRVYLPDRDLLVSVGDVPTSSMYVKLGRRWEKLDSVFIAIPATSAGTALDGKSFVDAAKAELVDISRAVWETARLVDHALGALPAILPLAMEFKRRTAVPSWMRILPLLLIGAIVVFALMGAFGGGGG